MARRAGTTITHNQNANAEQKRSALVLRWCHPLPAPPPLVLNAPCLTVGRDDACHAVLPSAEVSRFHAELSRKAGSVVVTDIGSKNGVFVNGQRTARAALGPGDTLRVGTFLGVLVEVPEGSDLTFRELGPDLLGGALHAACVARAREVAPSLLPLVIQGETGTGKDVLARAIHAWSGRPGPYLAVNCAVYSRSMAAAELFGFKKGAFTGAERSSLGHLRAAEGGTLFLDELLELPLDVQAMLLRAIEAREVLPLGEARPLPIDVRFIAATQKSLGAAVREGQFRADLQARLEGAVLRVPSLGDCREILPELFVELYRRHAGGSAPVFDVQLAERLCLRGWPLNIRELDMLARRLSTSRAPEHALTPSDVELDAPQPASPTPGSQRPPHSVPGRRSLDTSYDPVEVDRLLAALERHAGNVSQSALELGITRQKAYRILQARSELDAARRLRDKN